MSDPIDDEWEKTEAALKNIKLGDNRDGVQSYTQTSVSQLDDVSGIDSALMDALENPRERMNVLKYEDRIMRFVQSTDSFLDVPPIANSYQRLLIYRVAQRFGLEHNPSDNYNENGDRGIIFYKTAYTAVPSILLINLNKCEKQAVGPSIGQTATGEPGGKVKVMRRKANSNANSKAVTSSDKPKDSVSEREKAYAAARARIFGEDEASDGSSPVPSATPSPPLQSQEVAAPAAKPATQSGQQSSSRAKKKVVDAGKWKEKKVLIRDKDAERFDPDFARHGRGGGMYVVPSAGGPPPGPYNAPLYPPPPGPTHPGGWSGNVPCHPSWNGPAPDMHYGAPSRTSGFPSDPYSKPPFGSFEYTHHNPYVPVSGYRDRSPEHVHTFSGTGHAAAPPPRSNTTSPPSSQHPTAPTYSADDFPPLA
mmetsp:Transcript_1152/g.1865  ORF Transcript_1152/g.1865 Transcript_1152/m.1865 type:complete len:421 (+) Transcript_1152:89-1351(+)